MREKTQKNLFDNLMWYLLYLLPLIIWLLISFRTGEIIALSDAIASMGFNIFTDNQILITLSDIFATTGILPLFVTSDIILYMSYFISVFLIHLFVDFILFVPRLAHKWLNKLYGGD